MSDPTPLVFRLTTTGCLARAVEVETHFFGEYLNKGDFVGVTETLAWPAGNGDTKTATVNVVKDLVAEHDEGIHLALCFETTLVKLSSPPGGFGTVLNDDFGVPAPEVPVGPEFVCK